MTKALSRYIQMVFQLREGEVKKTLLLQLNIFLIITALLIIKPTINSLFLAELTADAIPLGYVFTALMAVLGAYFYNRWLERFSLNSVIINTLLGSITCLILFGLLFNFKLIHGWLVYIPYVWVAIFGLLTASQFWILANLAYNVRDAKRVFGFIGAGAIAGGICGGYFTSLLANLVQTENLLFIAAALIIACIPINRYLWKNEIQKLNTYQVSRRKVAKTDSALKLIKQSKLLSLIAMVVGISVLIAKLVDYQYSDYASRWIGDPEQLAAFFGFWFSTLSVISLLIQLFLTRRIVGTFGVGKSLLWLPSGILLGSVLLLIIPELWVVVFIKVVDGSLKQSVNKAATELLSIPIPIEVKKKTKTFTDVVIDSIATGLAGLILIFFINALNLASQYVSIIIIVLIAIWLYFIWHLRNAYIASFKGMLNPEVLDETKAPTRKEIPVTSIVETVRKVMKTGTESQIVYMLTKTLEVKDERFFRAISDLLVHPSAEVRALAIDNLYYLKTENLSPRMEELIHDDDQEVTTRAFRYLLKNYRGDTIDLFERYLNSEDATISNASLIGLSHELRYNKVLQVRFGLEDRIQSYLEKIDSIQLEDEKKDKIRAVIIAVGNARQQQYYSFLHEYLNAIDIELTRAAILSAANTLDPQFIDPIVKHLSKKQLRPAATEGLFNYGNPIIDLLTKNIKEEKISPEESIHVIAVVERFNNQKAIDKLIDLLEGTEHATKIEAIESIKRLKWKNPQLNINDHFVVDQILLECDLYQKTMAVLHSQIVIQFRNRNSAKEPETVSQARNGLLVLLEQRLDRQLQRIFRFLGIKYPPNDVDPILNTMLTGKEEQRLNAIEFLENILDKQLKRELIPVAESMMMHPASEEQIKKLNLRVYSEEECYRSLLSRKDVKLKLAVLYLIQQINDPKFSGLLTQASEDPNPKIRQVAQSVAAKVQS